MSPLADLRILVVEDEVLIALEIEERLQRLGCEIVGPVGRLERALEVARSTALDGALLDVNVKGGFVYPVAEELLARHVPVMSQGRFLVRSRRSLKAASGVVHFANISPQPQALAMSRKIRKSDNA